MPYPELLLVITVALILHVLLSCQAVETHPKLTFPSLYQTILEDGEKMVNPTTKLTIIEDKVYRVVQLPHRTLYQMYIQCLAKVFGPLELCDLLPHFRLQT